MQENEFADITITAGFKIACLRYRQGSELRAYTAISSGGKTWYARGIAETQIYTNLGLSIQALVSLPWQDRDKMIDEALEKYLANPDKRKLILRTVGSTAFACVTDLYVSFRHSEIWALAEGVMMKLGWSADRREIVATNQKTIARYIIPSLEYSEVIPGIFISNSAKGTSAIGYGALYFITLNNTFLMGKESAVRYLPKQPGDKAGVAQEFEVNLRKFLKDGIPILDVATLQGRTVLSFEEEIEVIKIPKIHKDRIIDDLKISRTYREVTSWDIVKALATNARRAPVTTRLQMERVALEIAESELKIKERKNGR